MEVQMPQFSKTQVAGFIVGGAAVGAVVALIFAPRSGAQTRREIRRISKKAVNQLDQLQSGIREQITEGYDQVRGAVENVKDYVEDGKNRLQRKIQTAR